MHILLVSHGYPTFRDPQWGCFEKDQAEALTALGHKVTCIAVDGRFRKWWRKIGITHFLDGKISAYLFFLIPMSLIPSSRIRQSICSWMMYRLVVKAQKEQGPADIIYAHYLFNMAWLEKTASKVRIPILGIEHWSVLLSPALSSENRRRADIGYSLVDKLLVVSPHLQKKIKNMTGMEPEIVPDMVNDMFFNKCKCGYSENRPFRFVSVASLVPGKAFDILLQSVSKLRHENFELVIIGDGPERDNLEKLSLELSVEDKVRFHGRLPKEKIVDILSVSDAFVLPSRGETFGVSYVEAMAMGLPVIATACGGPEAFVTSERGIIVNIDDVDGLASAMDRMIDEIGTYDSDKIREYVFSNYSGHAVSERLSDIMQRLCD